MGHFWIWCGTCHAEDGRDTLLYEPPHDPAYRQLGSWRPTGPPGNGLVVRPLQSAARRST